MQNALYGHVSLTNSGMNMSGTLILGITCASKYEAKELLKLIPGLDKMELQGVIVDKNPSTDQNCGKSGAKSVKLTQNKAVLEAESLLTKLKGEFKNEGLEFKILTKQNFNPDYLVENSVLSDLFCAGNDFLKDDKYNRFLLELNCSVLIYPPHTYQVDHLLYLYDGTTSGVFIMKRMIRLFGKYLAEASVSTLIAHDGRDVNIPKESVIVEYLLANFKDVGVLAISPEFALRELKRLYKSHPNSLIVTGHDGVRLLMDPIIKEWLISNNIPILYNN